MPHAVQVGFFIDPRGRRPQELLQEWTSLSDVAEATAAAGHRVTVVQACAHTQSLVRNGIDYHFLAPDGDGATLGPSAAFARVIRRLAPQLLHVHGLGFPQDVRALARLVPETPIILQDHADRPPRPWRRAQWRRGFAAASGIAFCALEQAAPFARARLLHPGLQIYEIPESSSHFLPGDRAQARRITGLAGDPALLWVGHLDRNKDPLTVLEGVRAAASRLPGLQLWCCFGKSPLMDRVRSQIDAHATLRSRVRLLGPVPHAMIQQLMSAADLFVLGSHREGSGYALIEALACGLPPAVTDIPSFRSLTGGGTVGRLWSCGDPQSLCDALISLAQQPLPVLRAAVRRHFEAELSFEAVGRKLTDAYLCSIERGVRR